MRAYEGPSVVSDSLQPYGPWPTRLLCPWDSPGENTGVGCHSLLQGIFPTQGSNPGLLYCRQILYQLNHNVSPRFCLNRERKSHVGLGRLLLSPLKHFFFANYKKYLLCQAHLCSKQPAQMYTVALGQQVKCVRACSVTSVVSNSL